MYLALQSIPELHEQWEWEWAEQAKTAVQVHILFTLAALHNPKA